MWHAFLDSQAEARGDRESESELIQCYYVPSLLTGLMEGIVGIEL